MNRLPSCVRRLEEAVVELLSDFGDEEARGRARERVGSLFHGCRDCGFRESPDVLRAMDSLLALPAAAALGSPRQLADRLVDLVGLLKSRLEKAERRGSPAASSSP